MTDAADQRAVVGLRIAMLADAPVLKNICAVILIFRNDIHYTGDGIGPVNGAASIVQNFNAINGS